MYKIVTYHREDPEAMTSYRLESQYHWTEHAVYTSNAMVSLLEDLADVDFIMSRLMKTQQDLGGLLAPYYKDSTVSEFMDLLKEHINTLRLIVEAAKAGSDHSALQEAWKINGNALVEFMARVNPVDWNRWTIGPIWNKHMALTKSAMDARINRSWEDEIAARDENHRCIADLADVFSMGVVNQNLEAFCR